MYEVLDACLQYCVPCVKTNPLTVRGLRIESERVCLIPPEAAHRRYAAIHRQKATVPIRTCQQVSAWVLTGRAST